jgi:lipopolysaccharide export LptBFGC system permease protein LptF
MKIDSRPNQRDLSHPLGKRCALAFATFVLLGVTGCSYSPSFNLLGSYFPAWIFCFAIATALTTVIHTLFTKTRIVNELWPLPVVYPCLIVFLSCTLWIIFFN